METKLSHYDVNDLDFMMQYLNDVYTVEKELFCSQQAKSKAEYMINNLGQPKPIENEAYYKRPSIRAAVFSAIGGLFIGVGVGFCILLVCDIVFDSMTAGNHLADLIIVIVMLIAMIICSIIGFRHGYEDSKYKAEESNREYINQDKKRVDYEKSLIPMYKKYKRLYSHNIASCQTTLNQLYNLNIISPKYRHLIAISQIYEYYTSRRCIQLDGYEGAYNLFDIEVARGTVVSNIEDILIEPEQIKQNQYMLYQACEEANERLIYLGDDTDAISYNTSVLAENSAICARYSGSSSS